VVAAGHRAITVDAFGACGPAPCQWGKITGTVFGAGPGARAGTSFAAQWNLAFARVLLLSSYGTPKKVPTLTVRELTTFTDGSSRANYTVTGTFTRGRAVKATRPGPSASGYPLGDPVTGVTFGASIDATTGGTFLAPYRFGSGSRLLGGTVGAAGTRRTVRAGAEFTGRGDRSSYLTTETLVPLR